MPNIIRQDGIIMDLPNGLTISINYGKHVYKYENSWIENCERADIACYIQDVDGLVDRWMTPVVWSKENVVRCRDQILGGGDSIFNYSERAWTDTPSEIAGVHLSDLGSLIDIAVRFGDGRFLDDYVLEVSKAWKKRC